MSLTFGTFKQLSLIKSQYHALEIHIDLIWGLETLFCIADEAVGMPHVYLTEASHAHIGFINYRPQPLTVSYHIKTMHDAIGFNKNASLPSWSNNEKVKTTNPSFLPSDSSYVKGNTSRLVRLPASQAIENETFEITGTITSSELPSYLVPLSFDAWILLNPPPQPKVIRMSESYDVFISHASEDKASLARPIAVALQAKGVKVWFDEFTLTLGDSLRDSIDAGLANSKHGVVILSPDFFRKGWTKEELDGLFQIRTRSGNKIMPIWHYVTQDDVFQFSPMLAGKLGIASSQGIDVIVEAIIRALGST